MRGFIAAALVVCQLIPFTDATAQILCIATKLQGDFELEEPVKFTRGGVGETELMARGRACQALGEISREREVLSPSKGSGKSEIYQFIRDCDRLVCNKISSDCLAKYYQMSQTFQQTSECSTTCAPMREFNGIEYITVGWSCTATAVFGKTSEELLCGCGRSRTPATY